MPAYNFQKQFVSKILSGEKPHTIRAKRKRPTKVGDPLMLYTGLRTKNAFMFAFSVCEKIEPIIIYPTIRKIMVNDELLLAAETLSLAKSDGFETVGDFFEFFKKTYKEYELDNFEIIHWSLDALTVCYAEKPDEPR